MIYIKLKKYLLWYMLSGFLLAAVIILISLINMYHSSVSTAVAQMNQIKANVSDMRQSIEDIDSAMKKITSLLHKNYPDKSHKELLMLAIDDIKMIFKDGEITITGFEEKEGELLLGINIKANITNYKKFVSDVEYLQNLRFPSFHFKTIMIEKPVDKKSDDILSCKIEGILKIPSAKIKGNV